MAHMNAYVRMPDPGDTVTLMVTGTLRELRTLEGFCGLTTVEVPTGEHVTAPLPGQPGVRILAGDITPTLMHALSDAIEYAGEQDPEWVAAEVLDRVDLYERAQDELSGFTPAACTMCGGHGEVVEGHPCPRCKGSGSEPRK